MVSGHNITLLVYAQAAIRIAIVRKTYVQALLDDKLLQSLNVSRTSIVINVQTIRIIMPLFT